ncbi:MAG TPA: hypothetical protein VGG03_01530 [Thermoanaerobaculia bacterium]|jgi:hypothetical protein
MAKVAPHHPCEPDLERFLRGGLPLEGVRAVVRHLLSGCPRCLRVTRRLWGFGAAGALAEIHELVRPSPKEDLGEETPEELGREILAELKSAQANMEAALRLLRGEEPEPAGSARPRAVLPFHRKAR